MYILYVFNLNEKYESVSNLHEYFDFLIKKKWNLMFKWSPAVSNYLLALCMVENFLKVESWGTKLNGISVIEYSIFVSFKPSTKF